ncbi:DUF748 domain-containing protein [Pelagicoccus enzymogenes]|uniref:DUF748 domain-containing protein n=1 Tax=Pelagicoccus enzymogenes TaxID=2773457 RepID=UPI00280F5014|nr:DUF748 domain-containing protein [Pelagicoccus enzymogenes]MDQ8199321.1 DUF748 domain-containing protein [Pelagicoccus enzymogenes]
MTRRASSKHSWRKRLAITGLVLFTLYIAFGIWGVPAILKSQIQGLGSETLGRDVLLERATFNPFSLEAKLYGLSVGPREGEAGNLLEIAKLSANPQLASVFGTITLKSVEINDADVWVAVDPSGSFSFQDILDAQAAAPQAETDSDSSVPSVIVRNLSLESLRFHYKDASLATPYEETLAIDRFHGRDIGTVEKRGISEANTAEAAFHWDFDGELSTGSGAALKVSGGALSLAPWHFKIKTELLGFPLRSLQPFVDEAVEAEVAGTFGFKLTQNVELSESGASITVAGDIGVEGVEVSDEVQTFAAWQTLRLEGIQLNAREMELAVERIALEAPAFESVLLPDGSPRLPALKSEETVASSSSGEDKATPGNFKASIDSVVVSQGRLSFEDQSLSDPFETEIENIELSLSALQAAQVDGAYDASGALTLALNAFGGKLELDAALESLQGLSKASLTMEGVELRHAQAYVSEFAHARLEDGVLGMQIDAALNAFENPVVTGSLELEKLLLKESKSEKEIASLASLMVKGVDFRGEDVTIESVTLVEPLIATWQDEAGINLQRIAKIEQEVEQKAEAVEESTGLRFRLARLELKSAGAGFVDTTLVSTHNSRLSNFDLLVEGVSTSSDELANFNFSGTVDGSARIAGKGKLNIADPGKYLDLDMSFRGYDLTSTSPYWATYLGRKLSKGQFEIISRYEVRDDRLEGSNDFKIDQLTLGEKVESERAINLPLGFAINLMRDPSGMISYNGLPVSGDLSDPQVKPWGLVGKAFRNLILNAVASPLKFLARLAGGREDLDSIAFAVSEVELDSVAMDKVTALRKLLVERPGLKLEASFLPDPSEEQFLKDQYLMHTLANPQFQVVSGLGLLQPVDREALQAAVESRYAEIQAASVAEGMEAGQGNEASEDEAVAVVEATPKGTESAESNTGLVKRLARFVGFGKKDNPSPQTKVQPKLASAPSESVSDLGKAESNPVESVSFEKMLAAVVEMTPEVSLSSNWIEDLSEERIRNFKTALLENGEVEANRIFSTALDEAEASGESGALIIRLTD